MATIGDKNRDGLRDITLAAFVLDEESEAELGQYLAAGTQADTRIARGNIHDVIAWLQEVGRSPQRLLVDITGSSAPLDELDQLANACEPSVQVYVLGDHNDVDLYRNLLLRGVQDYLVKPLDALLLHRALDPTGHSTTRKGRRGKTIAMAGTRGGVGATSIAVHLARELAAGKKVRRVVYLDLDPYGGSGASALGLAGGNALTEVLRNANRLDPQYLERTLTTNDNRLYAMTAEMPYGDEFMPAPGALAAVLDMLCQQFHYVIVDVPSCGGALANEAFSHAGLAGVVSDLSVHSARTLLRLARHIESHPNRPTVYTILNQTQPSVKGRVHVKDFLDTLQRSVQVQIGYDASGTALAENLGEPLSRKGEFAQGVKALAALVTGQTSKGPRVKWWQRLRPRTQATP